MPESQTKQNHVRFHAPFHFVFAPAILLLLAYAIYALIHAPSLRTAAQLLLVIVVFLVGFLARSNALKVQDRVIRLEERSRLSTLLPAHLQPLIYQLSERQLIALRFASDGELPDLAQRAQAETMDGKSIKEAITNWRPDFSRV